MSDLVELIKAERYAADLNADYDGGVGTHDDYVNAKAATDAAIANLTAARAVSLPDRTAARQRMHEFMFSEAMTVVRALGYSQERYDEFLDGLADAVLAALSTQPAAGEVEAEVLVEGSYFAVRDLPKILGNFMRSNADGWREVKSLTAQVQAAQATIAEAIAEGELVQEQFQQGDSLNSVIDILSRADTSALHAHDEALIRQHTQTILDATREATVRAIADAEVRGYRRKVDERITSAYDTAILAAKYGAWGEGYESGVNDIANSSTPKGNSIDPEPNPYRASIEQTEANRG